jgi:hypothetical protein
VLAHGSGDGAVYDYDVGGAGADSRERCDSSDLLAAPRVG